MEVERIQRIPNGLDAAGGSFDVYLLRHEGFWDRLVFAAFGPIPIWHSKRICR